MKKIGHFLKSLKATCNLIFPKCSVTLGKCGAGRSQFHIWKNFTNHFSIMFDFYNSLIYIIKSIVVIATVMAPCFHDYMNIYTYIHFPIIWTSKECKSEHYPQLWSDINLKKKLWPVYGVIEVFVFKSLSPTKWWNTLKQFVGRLPTNCLSVFDHFVGLALKGLTLRKLGISY